MLYYASSLSHHIILDVESVLYLWLVDKLWRTVLYRCNKYLLLNGYIPATGFVLERVGNEEKIIKIMGFSLIADAVDMYTNIIILHQPLPREFFC